MTERRYALRLIFFTLAIGLVWVALGLRLTSLHFGDNAEILERARRMHRTERVVKVGRGRILDAGGTLLALDLLAKDVCLDPSQVRTNGHAQFISSRLGHILHTDPALILNRIQHPPAPKFAYVQRFVDPDVAERIQRMGLPGVFLEGVYARYYPHGPLLCHVLGFSNREGVGSGGLELRLDRHLRGRPGLRQSEQDAHRKEIYASRSLDLPAQAGADVYLTIDKNVQFLVEQALQQVVQDQGAKGAWAIVQEVQTGRILAMASLPGFDPNIYNEAPKDHLLNQAIGYTFEPGSTMKAAVLAAAFNEGVVSPEDRFDCEDGMWFYKGRPLRDYHPYGILTVADILKKSSNIGTAKIALQLGEARLERYLREFGIGALPGSDLPGEESGMLAPVSQWDSLTVTRVPMGHSVNGTALHMACLYSTIANRGYRMRPYVVEKVVGSDGALIFQAEPQVVARPIREDTARLMCRLLQRVTEDGGTARRARVDGYAVAGKTGTAEKIVDGRYSKTQNIASFVGFLPADEPEITIVVVVDEPTVTRTGGAAAAPAFQSIAEQAVRYLDIPASGRTHQFVREPSTEPDVAPDGLPDGMLQEFGAESAPSGA